MQRYLMATLFISSLILALRAVGVIIRFRKIHRLASYGSFVVHHVSERPGAHARAGIASSGRGRAASEEAAEPVEYEATMARSPARE